MIIIPNPFVGLTLILVLLTVPDTDSPANEAPALMAGARFIRCVFKIAQFGLITLPNIYLDP